ncbi:ArsR/SmtB family transcription factor [Maritalea sp. S77]|jgi:DNA-binding transcriptional ArsR family regulator|uniref:ArsR/SmtB family transcription factor n=1 Tax=Maritalea sp. S77 TaxID=3415125 RepID=UPI003C7C245C
MTNERHSTANNSSNDRDKMCTILSALADPVRLSIVEQLAEKGELPVGAISSPHTITAPAISRHLRVLESAGVIERRIDRQWRICSLQKPTIQNVVNWAQSLID